MFHPKVQFSPRQTKSIGLTVAMGEWGPHSHKHKLNMADFILHMPLRFFARVFGNPAGDPVLLKSRGVTLLRDTPGQASFFFFFFFFNGCKTSLFLYIYIINLFYLLIYLTQRNERYPGFSILGGGQRLFIFEHLRQHRLL